MECARNETSTPAAMCSQVRAKHSNYMFVASSYICLFIVLNHHRGNTFQILLSPLFFVVA